jgi:hypothetical protein
VKFVSGVTNIDTRHALAFWNEFMIEGSPSFGRILPNQILNGVIEWEASHFRVWHRSCSQFPDSSTGGKGFSAVLNFVIR